MRRKYLFGGLAALAIMVLSVTALAVARSRAHTATQASQVAQRKLLFVPPEQKATLPELNQAVAAHPDDATALANLGNFHLRDRNFLSAADAYKKALAINPNLSHTWSALGETQIQIGGSDSPAMPVTAKDAFTRALALDPTDMRAHFYLTMEKDFAGKHDEAVGEWLKMLETAPIGSDADNAIRAALTASINRNLRLIKREMERVSMVQPRAVERKATSG